MALTKKDITVKLLKDTANDLNKVMDLEPAIDLNLTKDKLQKEVLDAAGHVEARDKLQPKTTEVLTALGITLPGAEAASKPDATKKDKEKAAPATPKKARGMTRLQAVGAVLEKHKKGITRADLVAKSDEMYEKKGGSANEKEAKWSVKIMIDCLTAVGLLTEDDKGKFTL